MLCLSDPSSHIVQLELPLMMQDPDSVRIVLFWPAAGTTSHREPDCVFQPSSHLLILTINQRERERARERARKGTLIFLSKLVYVHN